MSSTDISRARVDRSAIGSSPSGRAPTVHRPRPDRRFRPAAVLPPQRAQARCHFPVEVATRAASRHLLAALGGPAGTRRAGKSNERCPRRHSHRGPLLGRLFPACQIGWVRTAITKFTRKSAWMIYCPTPTTFKFRSVVVNVFRPQACRGGANLKVQNSPTRLHRVGLFITERPASGALRGSCRVTRGSAQGLVDT